jgi:zinc transport system ATP-binding protein
MPLLEVNNLNVRFGASSILKDISFSLDKGTVIAIVGPNGSGKTTLFKALLGVIPFEGEIQWLKNTKIGYVPQRVSIDKDLPLSVMEFLRLKNISLNEIYEALESVGFATHHVQEHFFKTKLANLSGGELQKVLIARAIMGHPDVLLFDEPTAGIDVRGEQSIYSLLEKLHQELGLTIMLISHDFNVIYKYATDVLCLNKERICYGPPKEVLTPEALEKLYGEKIKAYTHEHHS